MTEQEETEFKQSDESVVYLVASCDKGKAFLVLKPVIDSAGQVNSYMKAFFEKGKRNSWFTGNQPQIHKAANKYMLDNSGYIIQSA